MKQKMGLNFLKFCFYTFLSLSTSNHVFAIYGNYIDVKYHPRQTCLLKIGSGNNASLCSSTLIKDNLLITANHCLDGKQPNEVKINCAGESATGLKITNFGKVNDLALLEINKKLNTKPMKLANEHVIEALRKNGTGKYFCAFFGYGLDNNYNSGLLHGILSKSSNISIDQSFNYWVDWDREARNIYEKISTGEFDETSKLISKIELEFLNLPIVLTPKSLEEAKLQILANYKITLQQYISIVNNFSKKILTPMLKSKIESLAYYFENHPTLHFEYIKSSSENTVNPKRGNSGIDFGDSGGTFACRVVNSSYYLGYRDTEWVLVGVNSYIINMQYASFMKAISENTSINGDITKRYTPFGFASLLSEKNLSMLEQGSEIVSIENELSDQEREFDLILREQKLHPQIDNTKVLIQGIR